MNKQKIVGLVKFLIYGTFFVPLLVLPTSFIFPFIVPKILMFRSLVTLMIGGYILLLFINWQEFKPRFSALSLAISAFLASFAISTFAGVDPYHSFWDNHERMLGLFTVAHYVAYYFICSSVFKTWEDWQKALRIFLAAGSAVMFVGFLQVFKPDLLLNGGSSRVASTLGNSIYVGGYGMFLTFISFLLFIKERNKIWKWLEVILGALAILGMFFSGTRGSMLGFVAGFAFAILAYIVVLKDFPKARRTLSGAAIVGVALVSLLIVFRHSDFVQKIPTVNRMVGTSFADIKNSARWIAWEVAVESWKEKPVFGWGPNNFFYAFNKYYQPRSLEYGYGETWFDNAHNIIVNTLAVQGVVGLITYLSIFAVAIAVLVMARKKRTLDPHIVVVGMAFLVAHLVQSITVFENPTSYLYFVFWLAMIGSLSGKIEEPVDGQQKNNNTKTKNFFPDKRIGAGAIVTMGAVILLLIFIFNIQPARANMKTLEALKYLTYQPTAGVELMKSAIAFNSPHIDDIRSDLTRAVAGMLGGESNKFSKDASMEVLNISLQSLNENVILHPYDIRNYLTLSQLSQAGYSLTGDYKYLAEYERYLGEALKYSPRRQQIVYNLANFYLQTGRNEEAIKTLQQTIDDGPKVSEGYWRLAYVYRLEGKTDKVKEVLDRAAANNVVFSDQDKALIAQITAPLAASELKNLKKK